MQGIAAHPTLLGIPSTRSQASTGRRLAGAGVTALAVIMLAFAHQPAEAATIYKSVDERGNVQFSQTPPKDRPSETIEAGGSPPAPSVSAETARDEETPAAGDRAADPATEVKVVDREKARETCRQAREQREAVANSGNQLMVQDEDGKYQPMSEAQRSERLERLDAIIEEACSAAEE
ncbi:DUF4124 domain-containing protein [Guyparkeria hydrothermalis]|uniref:DUF4124 domain-containing protein n=1 Tax=Guyparkeria halophila TaxID=47960 RepID=A0A6I6D3F1_9GAMM|nr:MULTISPECIES: DUF4124 domain-containing protein [Guyparkeria]MCL7752036.1 DUF4124 domain-containing protein [Guyparkeria hydrothermalis]QGT77861.1 DUF4124 domain-containing protein [Guyparkeria halophila]TKA89297.1 DUF4124 domain-containing protein [Guyparkeria sp. SB14A]